LFSSNSFVFWQPRYPSARFGGLYGLVQRSFRPELGLTSVPRRTDRKLCVAGLPRFCLSQGTGFSLPVPTKIILLETKWINRKIHTMPGTGFYFHFSGGGKGKNAGHLFFIHRPVRPEVYGRGPEAPPEPASALPAYPEYEPRACAPSPTIRKAGGRSPDRSTLKKSG
jgi:hypothetical protein